MSKKTRQTRTKRKRRQDKQALKFGREAKPTHRRLGGRTGKSIPKSHT